MGDMRCKTVVILGGGGDIGAETYLRFAAEGASIAVVDLNEDAVRQVVERIAAEGGCAGACAVDLTDLAATEAAVTRIEDEIEPIDILVNNVGCDLFVPFLKSEPGFQEKIIAINLRAVLNTTHPVLARMAERKSGRIVSIASAAARVGSSREAVYAACKAGVIAFFKTLARERARQGITVNLVCPGVTETVMLENFKAAGGDKEKLRNAIQRAVRVGRLGRPDDLPGDRLLRQRRSRFYHRTGHQRVRRAHDAEEEGDDLPGYSVLR